MSEPRPAALPLPGGTRGARVRVHPILTGETRVPHAWIDRPTGLLALPSLALQLIDRGRWEWIPVPAFLVEHPEAGAILIDTGFHPSVQSDAAGNMGLIARFGQVRVEHDQALRFALPQLGFQVSDVRVVIMTHLHVDHASAVSEFPNATFVLDKREWAAAVDGGFREGYHSRQFDHAFDWQLLDFDADPVESFAGFAQTLDVFGDGSVRVASTRGHTLGHLSVILRARSREVLLIGDAAYSGANLRGETTPLQMADEHLYRRSLVEIRRYLEQTPGAAAIISHDADEWAYVEPVYE